MRGAQWVTNAYMLMLGALILVGGATGDRFGRRRVFALGVLVFTAASVACGLAPGSAALIAARAAQGVGGALLVPGSLAIISAAFPENERGAAIGAWAGFSALTTALGPVLGGWLVDALSWRAIFFVNIPIGVATVLLAYWRVPESRDDTAGGVDWRGGLLATAGLGAIAYGLTEASNRGWTDAVVLAALTGGVAVLAGFLWLERRASSPMLPLQVFSSRAFSGANIITVLLYFALSGALFFVPFNLIRIQGYSATQAGAAFLPFTLIMGGARAADHRAGDRSGRLRAARGSWDRRRLLDDLLPGHGGAGPGDGGQRGAVDDSGDGRCRGQARRRCLRGQQRRRPDRRPAGGGPDGRGGRGAFRRRLGSPVGRTPDLSGSSARPAGAGAATGRGARSVRRGRGRPRGADVGLAPVVRMELPRDHADRRRTGPAQQPRRALDHRSKGHERAAPGQRGVEWRGVWRPGPESNRRARICSLSTYRLHAASWSFDTPLFPT